MEITLLRIKNMKHLLLFTIAFFLTLNVIGQKRYYYDEAGNRVNEDEAVTYKDIKKNGDKYSVKEYYSSNDQLKLKGSYLSSDAILDERHGRFTTYHENGQLEHEVRFKNGKEDGEVITYYPDGKVKSKGEYFGGKETGEWVYYYENGQISGQGLFFGGDLNGDWTWYYEDGTPKKKARYKNGVKDGKFITYHKNGVKEIDCYYESDSFYGYYSEYWDNEKLSAFGKYFNNKRDSVWMWYHANGNPSCKAIYERGVFANGEFYNEKGDEMDKRVRSGNLVVLPKYPGGLDNFTNLVLKRIDNQDIDFKEAKKAHYNKTTIFKVELDKEGKVSLVKMLSPNEDLSYSDKFKIIETLRTAMNDLPDFAPKRAYNRYVESTVLFGIEFDAHDKTLKISVVGLED